MKHMILLLLAITLFSCAKEDTAPDTPAAPSAPSGGFTIPTTSFWRINSVNNGGSAEIVIVNVAVPAPSIAAGPVLINARS